MNARPLAFLCERVAMAHPTCLNLDAHFSRTRHGNIPFHNLKFRSRLGNLTAFIGVAPEPFSNGLKPAPTDGRPTITLSIYAANRRGNVIGNGKWNAVFRSLDSDDYRGTEFRSGERNKG